MTTGTPLKLGTGADNVGRLSVSQTHSKNRGKQKFGWEKLYRNNIYIYRLEHYRVEPSYLGITFTFSLFISNLTWYSM